VEIILNGYFQIFVVLFSPPQREHYHFQLFAVINDSPANSFSIIILGDSSVSSTTFSFTLMLFLHPISLVSISSQPFEIRNFSSMTMLVE
jgi:hypothetical protein